MSPGEIQASLQAKVSSHLVLVPEKNVPTKSTRNYFCQLCLVHGNGCICATKPISGSHEQSKKFNCESD